MSCRVAVRAISRRVPKSDPRDLRGLPKVTSSEGAVIPAETTLYGAAEARESEGDFETL